MLWQGLKTACSHSLMHIVCFLKVQSHSPVQCHFVCPICLVEIGVDESIVVLTIWEHVA